MSEAFSEATSHIRTLLGDYDGKSPIYLRWPRNKPCPYGDCTYYNIDIDSNCNEIDLMFLSHQNRAGFNLNIETGLHPPAVSFNEDDRQLVFKWLTIQIYVDSHLMDSCSARKRLMELNQLEFNNVASILYDGNSYWILVRIPDITSEEDQELFIRELPAYIAYLSIRWNLFDNYGNIIFIINPEVPLSESTIPLAGTLNHSCDPSCRTEWIFTGSAEPQKKVKSDIRRARYSFDSMGKTDGMPITDYIDRYISIIKVNRSFTLESFWNYSRQYQTLRTTLRFPSPEMKQSQRDLYDIITLRANFLASPAEILKIMETYYKKYRDDIEKPPGDFSRYIYRLILKADLFILKQLSTGNINEEISRKITLFARSASVLSACRDCPSIENIHDILVAHHGPDIILPEKGLYIIIIQKGQQYFISYRHSGSRYRYYYLTFPSIFLYLAGKRVDKRGVLLVRSEIAASFLSDINKLPPEKPIAINFWFYGFRYKIKQLSLEKDGSDFILNEFVLSAIKRESPDFFQLNGIRERDRIRKRKFGVNAYMKSKIPSISSMNTNSINDIQGKKEGDSNDVKTNGREDEQHE